MDLGVVRRWLHDVVKPYGQPDRIFADVDRTLVALPSLSPKTDVYTYDDGRTQLLLTLTGTIPVSFRSATYNIPIAIWFPRPYPREAPIVYVTPTQDMLVRKGKWVDVSGRVGGEYLEAWDRKPEGCNLLDLIHACQDIFGVEPPVYAKPAQLRDTPSRASSSGTTHASASSPSPQPASPSMPAQTRNGPAPPPLPPQAMQPQSDTPPPPPPPLPRGYESPRGYQSHSRQNSLASAGAQGHYSPQIQHQQHQHYQYQQPQHPYTPQQQYSQPQHSQPPASSGGPLPPAAPPWAVASPPRHPAESYNAAHRESPAPVGPPALPPQPPPPARVAPDWMSADDEDSSAARGSSTSGGTDTAPPPRPPNPELLRLHTQLHARLTSRLTALHASLATSNASLRALQADLQRGPAAIDDEMARLRAVRDVCSATRARMEDAVSRARAEAQRLRDDGSDVDEEGLVCATSIVGNQLLDLVAEDNAIEDTLYHLGRALNAERIDLATFLKQTRFLAREQFMRRALAQKITEGMGW